MQEVFEKIIERFKSEVNYNDGAEIGLKQSIEIVEQEAAEYNNGWIPCSVALPPQPKANPKLDGRYVELYMVSESESDYPFRAFWNGKAFTDGMFPLDVVAWQPLPEPYQPKGE